MPGIPYRIYFLPESMNFPSLPVSLSSDSRNWLISAIDPFHDFEHPIEGAPDEVVSRSYTRQYSQTLTVGCSADDDNIVITFTGFHGATANRFNYWGPDYACDDADSSAALTLNPIHVLRRNGSTWPCLGSTLATTSTILGGFNTAHVDDIPSRLVIMGLEVNDITPALYKRGSVHCNHCSGMSEVMNIGRYDETFETPLWHDTVYVRKPTVPVSATQVVSIPGAFVGPAGKGIYVAARLNEMRLPARGKLTYPNGTTFGAHQALPVLAEAYGTTGAVPESMYVCISDTGAEATRREIETASGWRDSGFAPFVVGFSGLASQSVLQISLKTTVEYFPQVTHPFECGLATYSPPFDPEAFRVYHEIMRSIPAAVPISMNAAGDYWRMLVGAARKAAIQAKRMAPYAGMALSAIGTATGDPVLALSGQALQALAKRSKPIPIPTASKGAKPRK